MTAAATAIEYGLIAALVAVAAVAAMTAVGTSLSTTFTTSATSLNRTRTLEAEMWGAAPGPPSYICPEGQGVVRVYPHWRRLCGLRRKRCFR